MSIGPEKEAMGPWAVAVVRRPVNRRKSHTDMGEGVRCMCLLSLCGEIGGCARGRGELGWGGLAPVTVAAGYEHCVLLVVELGKVLGVDFVQHDARGLLCRVIVGGVVKLLGRGGAGVAVVTRDAQLGVVAFHELLDVAHLIQQRNATVGMGQDPIPIVY